MNRLLLTIAVAALATPNAAAQSKTMAKEISYAAPKADAALSCQCHELKRRLGGLGALSAVADVASFSQDFAAQSKKLGSEQASIDSALSDARAYLEEAMGSGWKDQERLCGEGITKTNAAWGEWQPFLAQQEIDGEGYRGVKVDHAVIPKEGDLADNGKGKVCERGSWWTMDRAYFAINAREGICAQDRYEVKEILRGQKGDPGHRCWEYKLKQ